MSQQSSILSFFGGGAKKTPKKTKKTPRKTPSKATLSVKKESQSLKKTPSKISRVSPVKQPLALKQEQKVVARNTPVKAPVKKAPTTRKRKVNPFLEPDSESEFDPSLVLDDGDDDEDVELVQEDSEDEPLFSSFTAPSPAKKRKPPVKTPVKKTPVKKTPVKRTPARKPISTPGKLGGKSILPSLSSVPTKKDLYTKGNHEHDDFAFLKNPRDKNGHKPSHPEYNPRTLYVSPDFIRKQTPAMQQWWECKSENFDTVLFFKVGKFYELYHQDCDVAVEHLELVYMKGKRAHAGFPEIAYGKYSDLLVSYGFRVARLEQMETPAQMKENNKLLPKGVRKQKVVKREICNIKSKGTNINSFNDSSNYQIMATGEELDKYPERNQGCADSSYLLALYDEPWDNSQGKEVKIGVCLVDASAGTVMMGQFDDDAHRMDLRTLLARFRPEEIIKCRGNLTPDTERILQHNTSGALVNQLRDKDEFLTVKDTMKIILKKQYFGESPNPSDTTEASHFPLTLRYMIAPYAGNLVSRAGCHLALRCFGAVVYFLDQCKIDHELLSMKRFSRYFTPEQQLARGRLCTESIDQNETDYCGPVELAKQPDSNDSEEEGEENMEVDEDMENNTHGDSSLNRALKKSGLDWGAPVGLDPLDDDGALDDKPHMVLDGPTLLNLDIIEFADGSGKKGCPGTLLGTLDSTVTRMGRRLLTKWIHAPLYRSCDIEERLDAVTELMTLSSQVKDARRVMKQLPDLERLLSKIHSWGYNRHGQDHPDNRAIFFEMDKHSKVKIRNFLATLQGFDKILGVMNAFVDTPLESKLLKKCLVYQADGGAFPNYEDLLRFFDTAFDHTQAVSENRIIPRDGVDPEYDDAKSDIEGCEGELKEHLKELQRLYGSREIKFHNPAKDPYQLEFPETVLKRIDLPMEYDLKTQRKGKCRRYYSPEVREILERKSEASDRMEAALKNVMRNIFHKFSEQSAHWRRACSLIAELDGLFALAQFSQLGDGREMCRPEIVETTGGAYLDLHDNRHPCVSQTFTGSEFIPNTIQLGPTPELESRTSFKSGAQCILLTGPNMGGKSTLLRQTCIAVILAQMGCYVPASKFMFSPVDRIFTRVGASDRILAGQSTFFVELLETSTILREATPQSLVILDELGRGTSTYDGNAIAYSVIEHIAEVIGCRTIFATHYHNLTEQAPEISGNIAIGHMTCVVEEQGDDKPAKVTFLYKLGEGGCPKSHGFNVARLAKLPEEVIQRAFEKSNELEEVVKNNQKRFYKRNMAILLKQKVARVMKLPEELAIIELKKLSLKAKRVLSFENEC